MDTVNRVFETATKAIWGEQDNTTTNSGQAPAGNSQNRGMTGIDSVDKVVNAGKIALWGDQSSAAHGEEPVAGKRGLGTATDPYDAGNRDEQAGAPPVEAEGLPTNEPTTEQRNVGTSSINKMEGSSGTAGVASGVVAAAPDLKTTVTGLRPDPSQPGSATQSSLKHTSTPFEDEAQKLAKDLRNVEPSKTTTGTTATGAESGAGAGATTGSSQNATKHSKDASLSSTSTGSSLGSSNGQKSRTSKLDKVKNKLHIGHNSQKPSK